MLLEHIFFVYLLLLTDNMILSYNIYPITWFYGTASSDKEFYLKLLLKNMYSDNT
jgi:hypothetical protein